MHISLVASSLHKARVTLTGVWREGPRRRWEGTVSADEPIVGLAVQESYAKWSWCKSSARASSAQEASLLLGEYDRTGVDVKVTFACGQAK